MNAQNKQKRGWNKKRWFIGFGLVCFILYSWLWIRISPEETLSSKEFLNNLLRNMGLIAASFVLASFGFRVRFLKYIAPLVIAIGILISFDTVFLLMHFQNIWMPQPSKEINQQQETAQIIFESKESPHHITTYDYGYGFTNYINDSVRLELIVNNERLPDVYYYTDEFGRRLNSGKDTIPDNEYALFIGCSVTFGVHVADSMTLPGRFEKLHPEYHCYNYGIPASGPNQYLARFQNEDLRSQVKEKDGFAIYSFFEHHVNRAISDFYCWGWNRSTPYYKLEEEELVLKGDFEHDRWFLTKVFELFNNSYFIKYIQFNFPKQLYPIHYETTAAIIAAMRDEYEKQFGNDRFYVFMLPGFETGILPYFAKHELKVINCIECIPEFWTKGTYLFPIDNHPTGLGYSIMADSLTSRLNNINH